MKTTAEIEIRVSGAKVTDAVIMHDGICKITIEMVNAVSKVTEAENDDTFVWIEASKLSLNDEFIHYAPQTDKERELRTLLVEAIKSGGLRDFKRPKYDPSMRDVIEIYYEPGKAPAVDKMYNWWNGAANRFKPEYNSRLGTRTEYVAFLGVLIKKLVENGWSVKEAWDAVCNDSIKLGHYWNSENTKHNFTKDDLEPTGSREICGFYDLANCRKILAKEKDGGFWLAGGDCQNSSNRCPLANFEYIDGGQCYGYLFAVGWIVLD